MSDDLTHIGPDGRARMVDVSDKAPSERIARAGAKVVMQPSTLQRIKDGGIKKGDVLAVAQIAGIMAAKKTSELIPMCHPLPLDSVNIFFELGPEKNVLKIEAEARTFAKTGVEMEALTAASVAALTVYDMCKAVDRSMKVVETKLLKKSGGKSGDFSQDW